MSAYIPHHGPSGGGGAPSPGGNIGFTGGGGGDGPNFPPTNSNSTCTSGCLCQYSHFTLFINTSAPSPRPIYIVSTGWDIFYVRQLRHAIVQDGFTVIPNDNTTGNGVVPECGWQTLQTTWALGVRRGSLGINNQTDGLPHPQPGLGDTINALLSGQYPYVEITLVVTLLVGPIIVGILTAIAVMLSKKLDTKYIPWRRRKLQKSMQKRPKRPKPKADRLSTNGLKDEKKFSRPSNEKSRILQLPDELQLNILAYVDYESACSLRSTCKYYSELIDDSVLKPLQAQYIKAIIALERSELSPHRSHWGSNSTANRQFTVLYCTSCDRPRPTSTFSVDSHTTDPWYRICLPCKHAAGGYAEGFKTITAHNAVFRGRPVSKQFRICWVCKLRTDPCYAQNDTYTCEKCLNRAADVLLVPLCLVPFEFVFAVVTWAVASSGNAPSHFWAWKTITVLFWSTSLHLICFISFEPKLEIMEQSFVYHNTAFAGLLALGWIGVAIGMIYEQHVIRPQGFGFYDRHSVAVIPLCIIEGVLFSASCLSQIVAFWRIWRMVKSAPKVDARTLRRMLIDLHDNQRRDKGQGTSLLTANPSNV